MQDENRQHFNLKWGPNVGRSTISDILRQREKWLLFKDISSNLVRVRSCKEQELETALFCGLMMSALEIRQLHAI